MAILTRSANIQKGAPSSMTINRTELAALVSDPYYANTANWKEVYFQFKHNGSGQKSSALFVSGNDNADFEVTNSARGGAWQIEVITIKDYDGGNFQLSRDELSALQQSQTDFTMISGAINGDLYIANGETVQIAAGSDRQYGDLVIEAGGVLEILPGGAITTIKVTENCVINGTIKANSGNHTGGTWNKIFDGEALTYTINQQAGGNGGDGVDAGGAIIGFGGYAQFGNGGGGGKSHITTPQDGEYGQLSKGGDGGGGTTGGAVYGNDGQDGIIEIAAGAGGARGSHGQAVMLKAYKIQGGGTIDARGQKGGDGGDGTGGGSGHPAGGGGAGGSGGKIWLRHEAGTPNLKLLITAGERGVKGFEDTHITVNAQHGQPGEAGSTDVATY